MENKENELPANPGAEANQEERGIDSLFARLLRKGTETIGRWRSDRRAVTASLGRYSAHIAVITLAILLGLLGRYNFAAIFAAEPSPTPEPVSEAAMPLALDADVEDTLSANAEVLGQSTSLTTQLAQPRTLVRLAEPHTTIPDRPRLGVITYTVQTGDALFAIAEKFGLSPYTVMWSNMEILQGAPWLLSPGLTLYIPPVDGAYHTVAATDTVSSIAEYYEVSTDAIFNEWNTITPGKPLAEGTLLMVPGAIGEEIEWEPPPATPAVGTASASYGFCAGVEVSGAGGTGSFILPTGHNDVSGWYFHDPRNPRHQGLDYRCYLGDPIYAADSGVVVFAGWSSVGYGNLVRVNHGNGYETYYAHFDSIAVGCGQSVVQGQYLGACGTTGWSTGPHLHYEIRQGGVPVDPQLFE